MSEEAMEILEEQLDEHKMEAQKALGENPKRAAFHFSKAAEIHERLASEVQGQQVVKAHLCQADDLRANSHRLMQRMGLIETETPDPTENDSEKNTGDQSSSNQNPSTSDSKFFDDVPDVDLSDVGGMEELKQELIEDVKMPLEKPDFYRKQAIGMENGILFFGPPGTGKSYLAECFAGELGFDYAEISASDITSKYVGEAPKTVRKLFDEARSREPCVVFIDEIDSLASDRSTGNRKTQTERQIVNELLTQLQDIQGSQILVIAATNRIEDLDSAITRTGRFNKKFHLGPPNRDARKQILKVQLEEDEREVDWEGIDWEKLVDWSQGYSASDLEGVVKDATRQSALESTKKGSMVPVQYRHLLGAMKDTEASLKHNES
ncbi:ATP-binding protein [Halobium salinum]|uniref:ATP-binding protein n=1 Tax=Halobium salinum TaxID=1364940 RepID=A0ABD5PFP3_9EURY|nr:AAA family ATPase [Halobium salinum]